MKQRGVTLIELVVSIAVIATAAATLIGTLSYLSGQGADYLLQAQAQSIADSYLAEITGKSFADPNGADGEGNRCNFDDVDDYAGFGASVATDQCGNVMGNFPIRVTLTRGGLRLLPPADVWRIDVTVGYGNSSVSSTGYRTRYR